MTEPAYVNGFVDGFELVLLRRDEAGKMLARRRPAEWASFYRAAELPADVMASFRASQYVSGISIEGEWVRVRWRGGEWRRKAHEPDGYLDQHGVVAFEADVDPIRRFFSDTGATVAKPRRCYLDIETDPRVPPAQARLGKARILCWALTERDPGNPKLGRVVAKGVLERDDDEDEARLLEELWTALYPYDQVAAWFGDGFDFPIVKTRSLKVGARHRDPRAWLWIDLMEVYSRRNNPESGDESESLKLNDVCNVNLGHGKHDYDVSQGWADWSAGGERRERLVAYCCQDTLLLPELDALKGFLDLNDSVCEVARCFADTQSLNPTNFVDGFLLRMAAERGTHFPSRTFSRGEEDGARKKFAGAFVMEPKMHGIMKDVHVADFSGMYPSIILTWNMSPETKAAIPINGPIPDGHCRSPSNRVGFRVDVRGMLCDALLDMKKLRKEWQKRQATLTLGTPEWLDAFNRSQAYKVISNSFYGVMGSPFSRYFDVGIAEGTTQNGVWLIQHVIHEAEQRAMEVVYSDTDSVFVIKTDVERFGAFVRWCNAELFPRLVRECGCRENYIELDYQETFERIVMVTAKRYCAAFSRYKGNPVDPQNPKIEIRGLEFRRGDSGKIERALQGEVIDLLMRKKIEDPESFEAAVVKARDHVLDDPLPIEEVVQSASLSQPLRDYKVKLKKDGTPAAQPAHVQVAHVLQERGELVGEGTRIRYVVADAGVSPMRVIPADDYRGDADRYHLWEKGVWPATERLLDAAFPDEKKRWNQYSRVRPRGGRSGAQQGDFWSDPSGRSLKPKPAKAAPDEQGSLFVAPQGRGIG